jgi:predicted O-methyltransferase YrrM
MTVKDFLKRNKFSVGIVRELRRIGYRRMARTDARPFNGDQIMTRTVDFLLSGCDVKFFVETGTYLGQTCRYLASRHPHLPIITIESNPDFFDSAQRVLRQYANVKSILGDSAVTVSQLVQDGIEGVIPLFFLDAHWGDYLPLPEEIHSIAHHLTDAIMVIHDFQVPGMDYGFDVCKEQAIGTEMLAANIDKSKNYQIYFPNYTYEQAYAVLPQPNQQLKGYAIIFQGVREVAELFAANEYAQWYVRGDL